MMVDLLCTLLVLLSGMLSSRNPTFHFPSHLGPLLYFSALFFIFSLGDAIMSYLSPVLIEAHLHNALLMGLVVSCSSVVGFTADLLLGKFFGTRSYIFFVFWGVLLAIFFPISFYFLPPLVSVFILGMAVWGLYFELVEFALFAYVEHFHSKEEHAKAWGVLSSFRGASYMVGPALATFALDRGEKTALVMAAGFFATSLVGFLIFRLVFGRGRTHHFEESTENLNLKEHFSAMWIVFRRIWPVWLFTLALFIVDATFWTTGTLFSEHLGSIHPYGSLFMSVYMLPFMLAGLLASTLAKPYGKKRAGFIAGFLQGLLMLFLGIVTEVPILLLVVFSSSFFAAIALPEILATSEDYVTRLKGLGSIMVSLELVAASVGYVIGPTMSGYLTEAVGMQKTFMIMGGFLMMTSFVMLAVTPRKIHLPQQELQELEAETEVRAS